MKALWIIGGILLLLVLLSLVRVGAVLSFGEELRVRLRLGRDDPLRHHARGEGDDHQPDHQHHAAARALLSAFFTVKPCYLHAVRPLLPVRCLFIVLRFDRFFKAALVNFLCPRGEKETECVKSCETACIAGPNPL